MAGTPPRDDDPGPHDRGPYDRGPYENGGNHGEAPRAPSPDHAPGAPAHRTGAARADAVPRMENVRVTAPDLKRRAALERTRSRLVFASIGFAALFCAVLLKLAD